ncbi:hypothetical protein GCM10022221_61380 [Actinocorallia aurea]
MVDEKSGTNQAREGETTPEQVLEILRGVLPASVEGARRVLAALQDGARPADPDMAALTQVVAAFDAAVAALPEASPTLAALEDAAVAEAARRRVAALAALTGPSRYADLLAEIHAASSAPTPDLLLLCDLLDAAAGLRPDEDALVAAAESTWPPAWQRLLWPVSKRSITLPTQSEAPTTPPTPEVSEAAPAVSESAAAAEAAPAPAESETLAEPASSEITEAAPAVAETAALVGRDDAEFDEGAEAVAPLDAETTSESDQNAESAEGTADPVPPTADVASATAPPEPDADRATAQASATPSDDTPAPVHPEPPDAPTASAEAGDDEEAELTAAPAPSAEAAQPAAPSDDAPLPSEPEAEPGSVPDTPTAEDSSPEGHSSEARALEGDPLDHPEALTAPEDPKGDEAPDTSPSAAEVAAPEDAETVSSRAPEPVTEPESEGAASDDEENISSGAPAPAPESESESEGAAAEGEDAVASAPFAADARSESPSSESGSSPADVTAAEPEAASELPALPEQPASAAAAEPEPESPASATSDTEASAPEEEASDAEATAAPSEPEPGEAEEPPSPRDEGPTPDDAASQPGTPTGPDPVAEAPSSSAEASPSQEPAPEARALEGAVSDAADSAASPEADPRDGSAPLGGVAASESLSHAEPSSASGSAAEEGPESSADQPGAEESAPEAGADALVIGEPAEAESGQGVSAHGGDAASDSVNTAAPSESLLGEAEELPSPRDEVFASEAVPSEPGTPIDSDLTAAENPGSPVEEPPSEESAPEAGVLGGADASVIGEPAEADAGGGGSVLGRDAGDEAGAIDAASEPIEVEEPSSPGGEVFDDAVSQPGMPAEPGAVAEVPGSAGEVSASEEAGLGAGGLEDVVSDASEFVAPSEVETGEGALPVGGVTASGGSSSAGAFAESGSAVAEGSGASAEGPGSEGVAPEARALEGVVFEGSATADAAEGAPEERALEEAGPEARAFGGAAEVASGTRLGVDVGAERWGPGVGRVVREEAVVHLVAGSEALGLLEVARVLEGEGKRREKVAVWTVGTGQREPVFADAVERAGRKKGLTLVVLDLATSRTADAARAGLAEAFEAVGGNAGYKGTLAVVAVVPPRYAALWTRLKDTPPARVLELVPFSAEEIARRVAADPALGFGLGPDELFRLTGGWPSLLDLLLRAGVRDAEEARDVCARHLSGEPRGFVRSTGVLDDPTLEAAWTVLTRQSEDGPAQDLAVWLEVAGESDQPALSLSALAASGYADHAEVVEVLRVLGALRAQGGEKPVLACEPLLSAAWAALD